MPDSISTATMVYSPEPDGAGMTVENKPVDA